MLFNNPARYSVSKLDKQLRDFWEKASHMVTRKSEVIVLFDKLRKSVDFVPEFRKKGFIACFETLLSNGY